MEFLKASASQCRESQRFSNGRDIWVVFIRDLMLSCFIGVLDHEKKKKQPVRVSVKCYAQLPFLIDEDFPYICYNTLITTIETFVAKGHIPLVESLAESICEICFENQSIYRVYVSVEKTAVYPHVNSVGVEIDRLRKEEREC
jgi:dihydroneopterin aldolase